MSRDLKAVLESKAPEAERAVIGAVLLRPESFYQVELAPEDFASLSGRTMWASCARIAAASQTVDPIAVEADLTRSGEVQAVGGLAGIMAYLDGVLTADNVAVYARLVRDAATKRQVARRVYDALLSDDEGEAFQSRVIEAASSVQVATSDGCSLSEALDDAIRHIGEVADRRQRGEPVSWGVPTGFGDLDLLLGGLEPGSVTVVGGSTSQGKSVLVRQIAINAARCTGGVDYVTPEDRRRAVATRALVAESRVPMHQVRAGELDRLDFQALLDARASLGQAASRFHVDDTSGVTIQQIAHRVRRRKAQLGTVLVVLDYVQLIRDEKAWNRKDQVDRAAYGFAELCERERVAGILVSQLNREKSKRENPEPQLSDLKESGDLEQVATNVLFIHRDAKLEDRQRAAVFVRKQKNGRLGRVELGWDGARTALYDLRGQS